MFRMDRKRRYTERVLERAGLLGNQRALHEDLSDELGEDQRASKNGLEAAGPQCMSTNLAASLMLAVASGAIEPQGDSVQCAACCAAGLLDQGSLARGFRPDRWQENIRRGVRHARRHHVRGTAERVAAGHRSNVERWDQKERSPGTSPIGHFTNCSSSDSVSRKACQGHDTCSRPVGRRLVLMEPRRAAEAE